MPKITVITTSIRPHGLAITQECLKRQTFQDFEWLVELGTGLQHDLNASYNRALRRAKGELVISLQDYIKIPDDGLEKFWNAYQENKNMFFTAPVGKCATEEYENPKYDWRNFRLNEEINYSECEMDWGAFPLSIAKEIGGFDEALDAYWSSDNVNFCYRAKLHGVLFKNIENNAQAYDHDANIKHPFREKFNPNFNNERMKEFDRGLKLSL